MNDLDRFEHDAPVTPPRPPLGAISYTDYEVESMVDDMAHGWGIPSSWWRKTWRKK